MIPLAARWARINRRADRRRPRGRVSIAAIRVAELTRLFVHRYGRELPDDDAGRDDAMIVVHHLAALSSNQHQRIIGWLELRAPWISAVEAEALASHILQKRIRWRAATLAERLGLTAKERRALRIKTISAIDETPEQRLERRREHDRRAKQAKRKATGSQSRQQYLAASGIARTRPWERLGMSRATWYRAGKPA
jgi:hypothetical protein